MAAIDKTYVTYFQYQLAKDFAEKTYEQQIREIGNPICLYPENSGVLWNTSAKQDIWLRKNCPLDFVQSRLAEQYDYEQLTKLAELVDFSFNGIFIRQIETPKDSIYFWKEISENEIEVLEPDDAVVIFGTTHFLKLIDTAVTALVWKYEFGGEIRFDYYGAELIYKNKKVFVSDNNEIEIGFIPDYEFKFPKFIHSYKSTDCLIVEPYRVIISGEDECYDLTSFKDLELYLKNLPTHIKSGRFGIPKYITNLIK